MKKAYLLLMIGITSVTILFAQPLMQASIGAGSQPNRVKIYVKPAATQTPANISTLQFNIGISTTITPKPTMTVVSTTFTGVIWNISQATEGGYYNYQLTTATAPLQPNTTANTEFEVMEVQFSGGPLGVNNVALVTLADGGLGASVGNSLFLCTGSLASVGTNLYYSRTGTTVVNQNSYDASGATSGVATSTASVANIRLPLTWVDFSAQKNNNSALLKWQVENYNDNAFFNVEVSVNGTSFTEIAKIAANNTNSYSFSDAGLITRTNGKYVYYRIKQNDRDGKYSYSKVASISLSDKSNIAISPNPASDFITVSGSHLHTIQVYDNTGRLVQTNHINNATSAFFFIGSLAKGVYQLKIVNVNGEMQMEKFIKQ